MGPKKNKAAVRSQKEDSCDYLKSEGSRERAAVIDKRDGSHDHHKREGSLRNTKVSSLLSPPQTRILIHDYRKLDELWRLLSFSLNSSA
jgi:hypothetical protein